MFVAGAKRLSELLQFSLAKAEREVIISSPWITGNALRTMLRDLRKESKRISIHIYTDYELNRESSELYSHDGQQYSLEGSDRYKEQFDKSVRILRSLDVSIHLLHDVHNKSLVVDDKIFVDGSFNWLSAWRLPGSPLTRHDSALVISGKRAHRHRCEYLNAQHRIKNVDEPIYLDDNDRDDALMDFIDLTTGIVRFPTGREEPSFFSTSLKLPKTETLFFAVVEEDKNRVVKRGIDDGIFLFNGGSIPLIRTDDFQLEDGLVTASHRSDFEDPKRFVVFCVDRTKLEVDINISGTFSREAPVRDRRSPLQTKDIIPPIALTPLPTVSERK